MNKQVLLIIVLMKSTLATSLAKEFDTPKKISNRIRIEHTIEEENRKQLNKEKTFQPLQKTAPKSPMQSRANSRINTDSPPLIKVVITGLDDLEYRKNAEAFLDIYAENGKSVKNASYIDYLAQSGIEQIRQALQPFGYYMSEIILTKEKTAASWEINYKIKLGKPVIVKDTNITLSGEGKKHPPLIKITKQFPLHKGEVLLQPKYSDFKDSLVTAATDDGFFDANFTRKQIIIDKQYDTADIQLNYDTGARYLFGDIIISQDFLNQDLFERYKNIHKGEPYTSKDIADLQRDLYNSGYVKVIDIVAKPNKSNQTVPVKLTITPQKNKQHIFSVGYGTDTGIRGRYNFDWRWANRKGHKLNTELFLAQKHQQLGATYIIPGKKPASDYYSLFANTKRNRSGDIESTLWNFGGAYQDKKGNLSREFGIKRQQEDFSLGNDSGNISLLTPYVNLTYLKTDNPLDTHDGLLLGLSLTGASKNLFSDVSLFQTIAKAKYIKRINDSHKITLAGSLGKTWSKNFHQLPTNYRFFTGGDRNIRGYRFNHIGDRDSSGKVIGGDKMFHTSAEYEYFFRPKMATAFFIDAGDAYSADSADIKVGAGIGLHYYSPIGPIKVNVAHGFSEPGDNVRLHLSIGQELP